MDLLVACHPQMSSARPPTSVPWVSAQTDEFRSSKIVRWQKFNGFKIRHRTFAPMKFPANGGITHRLRRASSADSDYPPATHLSHSHVMLSSHRRQDKSVIRRPLIGSSSVGYRKHRTIISGSSADDWSDSGQNLYERGGSDQMSATTPVIILPPTYQWRISVFSHGQVSCVSCYLPVIVRHYSDELRWSPDESVLPLSHQCLVTIGLPTGCSDHTPASNVPALYLRDKLKCVRPISDEIGRKWKIYFPTSFRPAAGLCGRGA